MSRGPGRIERAIRQLLDASPDRAFLTGDLVKHCFPDARWVERKHEVSVLRATRKIIATDPDWFSWRKDWGSIVFNHASLRSYARFEILRREGRLRRPGSSDWGDWEYPDGHDWLSWRQEPNVERGVAVLSHPYCQGHMTPPDGDWWKAVRLHCAERDGDEAVAAPLWLEAERESATLMVELHAAVATRWRYTPAGMFATLRDVGERLASVAAELRELALINDPDALRAGLIAVAEKLEGSSAAGFGELK